MSRAFTVELAPIELPRSVAFFKFNRKELEATRYDYWNAVTLRKIVRSGADDIRVSLKVSTIQRKNVRYAETKHRCNQSGIMNSYAYNLMIQ